MISLKGSDASDEFDVNAKFEYITKDGRKKRRRFIATLKRPKRKDFLVRVKSVRQSLEDVDSDPDDDLAFELVADHLVGWKGLTDHEGNDIPYSKDMAETLLEDDDFFKCIDRAFTDLMTGRASVKN